MITSPPNPKLKDLRRLARRRETWDEMIAAESRMMTLCTSVREPLRMVTALWSEPVSTMVFERPSSSMRGRA